jgi:2-oxoacid:acceptor oxidoreductase gamma subunit (pyruvate/2-ketoisovalerate family)
MKQKKYKEIIWYGRGGQGAITASQLIAEAANIEGCPGITTAPSFGAERRGAPVAAFLRLADEPIRIFSQILKPDIAVVLDPTLLPVLKLKERFDSDTIIIVNSHDTAESLGLDGFNVVGIADITKIALANDLKASGVPILNTPILGSFVKLTGLVKMESVAAAIRNKFSASAGERNVTAAMTAFEETRIHEKK